MRRQTVQWIVYGVLALIAFSIALELLPLILIAGLGYYGYRRYVKKGDRL
jgi:hypothetical protein